MGGQLTQAAKEISEGPGRALGVGADATNASQAFNRPANFLHAAEVVAKALRRSQSFGDTVNAPHGPTKSLTGPAIRRDIECRIHHARGEVQPADQVAHVIQ